MSRILKAYESRFRWRLEEVRARRLDQGVRWLVNRARALSTGERISLAEALTRVDEHLALKLRFRQRTPFLAPARFYCDAGLGGLARWLRAAGYEAFWQAGIDDTVLLAKARELSATVLTTDGMLMERRLLRDRVIPSFWLPPTLSIAEQLALVFREFKLQLRDRRCMQCGGALRKADKEALRDQIPPRTFRWLAEYYVCSQCAKVFWHGTHWERIHRQLECAARGGAT